MKIRRLYIKDFGIFNNQHLNGIDGNLVVIGGLNRAGKTTFLQILRYLGYGFPRGQQILPPARNKYEVEGEILLDNDEVYNLELSGYAEPKINCINGKNSISTISQIYNNLDLFTYQQLFTLSLDELQRLPAGVNKNDGDKLQSILLGAGLSEIIKIPQLEEEFNREADKIGGTRGTRDVKDFKPYNEKIKEGLQLRKEANSQLKEYNRACKELAEVERKIGENEGVLLHQRYRLDRLDLLKNNYENYRQLIELEERLSRTEVTELLNSFPEENISRIENLNERYRDGYKNYRIALNKFNEEIPAGDRETARQSLLTYKREITSCYNELSGLKERINNYNQEEKEYTERREEIILMTGEVNNSWDGIDDFEGINSLGIDLLKRDELNNTVINHRETEERIKYLQDEVTELQEQLRGKREQKEQLSAKRPDLFFKKYFYLATGFLTAGLLGIFLLNLWSGLLVGFVGIGGTIIYGLMRKNSYNIYREQELNLDKEVKQLEDKLHFKQEDLNKSREKLKTIMEKLREYAEALEFPGTLHPEIIKNYFQEVKGLQKEIRRWQVEGDRIDENRESLIKELKQYVQLVENFSFTGQVKNEDNLIGEVDGLISRVTALNKYKDLALTVKEKESIILPMEEEIRKLLNLSNENVPTQGEKIINKMEKFLYKAREYRDYLEQKKELENIKLNILNTLKTDRARTALEDYLGEKISEPEGVLPVFGSLFAKYTSKEDVENSYKRCMKEIDSLEGKLEELKNQKQSLKDNIESLATSSKLEEAQKKIDEGRTALRKLAEKYAVYKSGALILNKVRQRFIEKTKDTLLNQASEAFTRITAGEYKQILPPDNLIEPDFRAVMEGNICQETTEILSRGTKEQLFLAVRLSRIQKIQPPLPVIVDDTLVNFDTYHLAQALKIIKELGRTHQLIILTCHPHFIKYLPDDNLKTQYWQLEKGVFTETNREDLINYLTC